MVDIIIGPLKFRWIVGRRDGQLTYCPIIAVYMRAWCNTWNYAGRSTFIQSLNYIVV